MPLQSDIDLLNPPAELEKSKHKLKRLVQSPNSFFMDVKCQGCFNMCVAARGAAGTHAVRCGISRACVRASAAEGLTCSVCPAHGASGTP